MRVEGCFLAGMANLSQTHSRVPEVIGSGDRLNPPACMRHASWWTSQTLYDQWRTKFLSSRSSFARRSGTVNVPGSQDLGDRDGTEVVLAECDH